MPLFSWLAARLKDLGRREPPLNERVPDTFLASRDVAAVTAVQFGAGSLAALPFAALHGGLMGLPAIFILTSWLFKYAYILFDHTVWGYDEPPALDIQMLNPANEQRPLAAVVHGCA